MEQQIRRWQLRPDRSTMDGGHFRPVVTISREFGSLGLALGQRVAERLGFSFWDHEIVSAVAQQLHVDPDKVGAIDEHPVGAMAQLFNALHLGREDIASDYHDQLRLLLASIGRHGAAVIVGRGAHLATDPAHALRVRLIAPLVHRVRDYQLRFGTSTEEAYRQVRAGDKERADFVRQAYHADIADRASTISSSMSRLSVRNAPTPWFSWHISRSSAKSRRNRERPFPRRGPTRRAPFRHLLSNSTVVLDRAAHPRGKTPVGNLRGKTARQDPRREPARQDCAYGCGDFRSRPVQDGSSLTYSSGASLRFPRCCTGSSSEHVERPGVGSLRHRRPRSE
ncbi:MAG: cytidylate kinase-like family protein [Polyangiaceae bacterium]